MQASGTPAMDDKPISLYMGVDLSNDMSRLLPVIWNANSKSYTLNRLEKIVYLSPSKSKVMCKDISPDINIVENEFRILLYKLGVCVCGNEIPSITKVPLIMPLTGQGTAQGFYADLSKQNKQKDNFTLFVGLNPLDPHVPGAKLAPITWNVKHSMLTLDPNLPILYENAVEDHNPGRYNLYIAICVMAGFQLHEICPCG